MNTLNKYNHDRPAQVINKLKKAFGVATTEQRKHSLIRRFAVAEKRAIKILNLVSAQPANTLIH